MIFSRFPQSGGLDSSQTCLVSVTTQSSWVISSLELAWLGPS